MVTEIQDVCDEVFRLRIRSQHPSVGVTPIGERGGAESGRLVDRAEFLAAIQSELHVRLVPDDAIVIEPYTLAWVGRREPAESLVREVYPGEGVVQDWQVAAAKAYARMLLAAAEYLATHPPVDEEQVQALTALVTEGDRVGSYRDTALHLYAAGVRIEVKP